MLRSGLPLCIAAAILSGCGGNSGPATPASALAPASTVPLATSLQPDANLLGLYDVDFDESTGELAIVPTRSGALTQDRYQLPIDGFLRPGDFRLIAIERSVDALELEFRLQHPFAAPTNLAGPATAANRADLGVVPRLILLADLPTGANAAEFTYFGSEVARPGISATADGYCDIGALLPTSALRQTTLHPFQMAVDELIDGVGSREGIPSGSGTGNYNAAQGGWQQTNIGANRNGWTGYQMLHQGQATRIRLSLSTEFLLDQGDAPLQLAMIAEYLDPRGGTTSAAKRANRLPKSPFDVTSFVYRMPHGAPDLSRSLFLEQTGTLEAGNSGSVAEVHWRVTDFDARAVPAAVSPLSSDPNPATVIAGAQGVPVARLDVPGVTSTPASLTVTDDDTVYGGDAGLDTGTPEDPLYLRGTIPNSAATGAQTPGNYWGLLELVDPEDALDRAAYEFAVDAALQPVASGLAHRVWQFAAISVGAGTACTTQSLLFDFNSNAQGWTPFGTNSDQYDWSHFRQGCANAVSEANALGVLSGGGGYLSMSDDNDNVACELVTDYGPSTVTGIKSPLMTLPEVCNPNTVALEFDAYMHAQAGAIARAFYSTSSDTPGAAIWTQTATGEEQIFANQIITLPDTVADGPGRIWFTFTGGATLYETPTGELAGLAIDNVELRLDALSPPVVGYTPTPGACAPSTITFDFSDAGGWQGGQFFGLPNGDGQATIRPNLGGLGSFRWTACDSSSDPTGTYAAVVANSAGGIVGTSLNVSSDQDLTDGGLGTGCNFLDDYGGPAAYNIVSPRVLIPAVCGVGDEVAIRWNAYQNSDAASGLDSTTLRLYISTDDGLSWGTPVWTQLASNGGTASINQLIYLDAFSGLANGVRFRFEWTSSAGSVRQSATLGQPFGCYIDMVRITTNSATTPVILP